VSDNNNEINLSEMARRIMAQRGLDPLSALTREFSPVDHMVEHAEKSLAATLPRRFRDASTDNPAVIAWVERAVEDLTAVPSLLLVGPVGTGKTHQAIGAMRGLVMARAALGKPITFMSTSHPTFNERLRVKKDDTHSQVLPEALAVDVLVIDDLGAGIATPWTADTLFRLIDGRWSECRPLICTTNLSPAQLREMDDRVASRLADGMKVALLGGDWRRGGARP